MVQSTPQRSGMVQRTPQHPAMVQALPEQAQAVRSPAGPPRTVAAVSTQGAGQTLAERRNLAEIMSQVTVPEAERKPAVARSEEHTSELQSLMRSSYAVFCLKNKQ